MLVKIVIAFVAVCLLTVKCQHVSLIGSQLMPIESDYNLYLVARDLGADSAINVTFESGQEYENYRVFENFTGSLSEQIQFEIPKDLPPNYKLSIIHKNKTTNLCSKQSIRINNISNRRMLFIQLDKPVYKNGDTVKFRIFLTNQRKIPVANSLLNVTIFDGNKNLIKKFKNVKTSKIGVYENFLKIADSPNFGEWRIQVDTDGRSKSKSFQILHHDEDSFEVLVDSLDKVVSFDERYVFLYIRVKHPNDKIFNGIAKISSKVKEVDNPNFFIERSLKAVEYPRIDKQIVIKIDDDLGIRSPSRDMIIELNVEVVENKTQKSKNVILEIPMRHRGKHKLSVIRDEFFKPGFDFKMIVEVNNLNDQPDSSLHALRITVDYESLNPTTHTPMTNKKIYEIVPKNGEVQLVLTPTKNTKSIKVYLEIAHTEFTDKIESIMNQGVDEYMQVTILREEDFYEAPKIIQLSAKSSRNLETLHLIVTGSNGLLFTKDFPEAQGKQYFKLNLQLTEEMAPKCHVIVFYVRKDDGLIIHDEVLLTFNYPFDKSLDLAPIKNMKPNQYVPIKFRSPVGSFVFLSAVDQNLGFVNTGNEISRSEIYKEATHFMKLKFNNISTYKFNKFNAFVMQPLINGRSCNEVDKEGPDYVSDDVDDFTSEQLTQNHFSNIWFEEVVEVKSSGIQSFEKKLPNDLTSWRLVGASIHPTYGFAIGNRIPKIKVDPEIVLKIHTPATIHEGEILKVEFSAFSFLKDTKNAQIVVNVENGDLITEKLTKKSKFSKTMCINYIKINLKSLRIPLQLPAGSISKIQQFFVQPTSLEALKIKITVTAENYKDEIEKNVKVKSHRNLRKATAGSYLIELNGNDKFDRKINLPTNEDIVNVYATLSGNMLGPVLYNLDEISDILKGHPDHGPYKLMLCVIVAEYLESREQKIPDDILNEMLKGYQKALSFLQSDKNKPKFWIYAHYVITLIDSHNFITVDIRVVENALDNIRNMQNGDGSFTYDPVGHGMSELGPQSSHRVILTAQITLAFLKYQKKSDKYAEVIRKAMSFLSSTKGELETDYGKSVAAYTFDLFGDQNSSKSLISGIQNSFLNAAKNDNKMPMHVLTATYMIELKLNNDEDPKVEVEWLLNQRNSDGSFYTSLDTLKALYALILYSSFKHTKHTSLSFQIDNQVEALIDENEVKYMNLPKQNQYHISVIGEGLGYMTIYYEYFKKSSQGQLTHFLISVKSKELSADKLELAIDVELISAGMNRTTLAIIEVEMLSGYEYYEQKDDERVEMIKHQNNRTLAILYVNTMEVNKTYRKVIQAVKVYQIEKSAKSTVKVYDYNRPNIQDEIEYSFNKNAMQC